MTVMMPSAMPAMVTVPSAMAPVVVMMAPAHFGRELPRVILYRARGTRIDQRHRTRLPGRRCHHQNCGDSRKTQNFRHVHLVPPLHGNHVSAVRLVFSAVPPRRRWIGKMNDVNAD